MNDDGLYYNPEDDLRKENYELKQENERLRNGIDALERELLKYTDSPQLCVMNMYSKARCGHCDKVIKSGEVYRIIHQRCYDLLLVQKGNMKVVE